jgi:hypothetical protein
LASWETPLQWIWIWYIFAYSKRFIFTRCVNHCPIHHLKLICGAPAPKVKIKGEIWQRPRGRRRNEGRENIDQLRTKTREVIVVFNMVPKPNLTNISG